MDVKKTEKDGVWVVQLSGKIMGGPDERSIQDCLSGIIEDGNLKVVLDLGKVEWMNSVGIGICISNLIKLRNRGGDLKLAELTGQVAKLMDQCRVITIFQTYDSLDEAVSSF